MSSLSSILEESEDVFGDTEWAPAQGGILLSRSKVTYRGPNTYRNKCKDILKTPPAPVVCEICLETRDLVSSTSLCTHHPMVCASCLGEYLSHAIRVEGLTTFVCPAVRCEQLLGYGDVVKHIAGDAECLDRFNALITQRELERHADFRWCTNPTCGQGQIYSEGGPIITCDHCHTQSCFFHKVPWHQGLTCEEYTVEREHNANEEYLTTHTKPCPSPTCGRPIEKVSGCDHMTCRCRHRFCWSCMADYSQILQHGTHRHDPSCRHYLPLGTNPTTRRRRRRRRVRRATRGNRGRLVAMMRGLQTKIGRLFSSLRRLPFRRS
ncbi:hypothetical protein B0J17DRAFT_251345 [Rhizoctonia solani]|nr:hypothetical protein B0J17DRAFT_251345 [Rhizoctonia solani]